MAEKTVIQEENTILLAIRKTCVYCMGGDKKLITDCPAGPESGKSRCILWEYRQGPLTQAKHFRKRLLAVIHKNCIKCVGSEKEVNGCTCDGRDGYKKCLLFDYRNGNRRV